MKHQSKYRDRSEMKTSTYVTCKVIKEGILFSCTIVYSIHYHYLTRLRSCIPGAIKYFMNLIELILPQYFCAERTCRVTTFLRFAFIIFIISDIAKNWNINGLFYSRGTNGP